MSGALLVIGVDPGKECGLAWYQCGEFGSIELPASDTCGRLDITLDLARQSGEIVVLAMERYTITGGTAKKTRQYDALEVIGVGRYLARKHGATFLLQGAAEAQGAGNPDVLRSLGWWAAGLDHANKAASQVVLALAQTRPRVLAELVDPGTIS